MKSLRGIILEKLKVDDIVLSGGNFPIDGDFDEMIEWLQDNGFVEDSNISLNFKQRIQAYNLLHNKIFSVYSLSTGKQIRIVNTIRDTISKRNPIISISFHENFIEYMISWPSGFHVMDKEECEYWIKKIIQK